MTCIFDESFRQTIQECINPYGVGDAGLKISNILDELEMDNKKLLRKEMTLKGRKKNEWFQ